MNTRRIHSDKLVKGMIVQMGHDDFRTVTGMEFYQNGRCVYFLDDNPSAYVLDGYVNVQDPADASRQAFIEASDHATAREAAFSTDTAHALNLQIGTFVEWQHPTSTRTNYGKVSRIGDRFVEVRDSVGSEGILPQWIVSVAGKSVLRSDADALRDTANHHQGTRVHATDADHGRQLRRQGLTGPRGGLTRRGSIAAERLRNATLDDAFGPL
jgi:hypothetical protein